MSLDFLSLDFPQDAIPYGNLEWLDASFFLEYLLRYATPQNGYVQSARELFRYIEDQFVEWEPTGNYITPGVREQYVCCHVIDAHSAHYIRACLAFHRRTGEEIYLKKARAMADTLTAVQHSDGYYPTFMRYKPSKENPTQLDIDYSDFWANCTSYAAEMLLWLGEYIKNLDKK